MVLDRLSAAGITGRRIHQSGKHDEAGPTVTQIRADDHQRSAPHIFARPRHTVGQQVERVDRAEVLACDAIAL